MAVRTAVTGVFPGFRPGALFKLADGSYWLQADDRTVRHYAVNPGAEILLQDDGCFLKVDGIAAMVSVRQLHDVIESRIKGRFTGWTGRTSYLLTNGQTWQQAKYMTKSVVKYMPEVLIYRTPAGPVMTVAGTSVHVRQTG